MKNVMTVVMAGFHLFIIPMIYGGSAAESRRELTAALLTGTTWGPEHQAGKHVTFRSGGVYDGREDYIQDGQDISGTYSIAGGKVNLTDNKGASYLEGGVLMEDLSSLLFTRYLKFNGGVKLWDLHSKAAAGRNVSVAGTQAVTMGVRSAKITTNAKFRTGPAQSAKELTFERFKEGGELDTEKLPFLPAGTRVVVLARTARMAAVQKWKNYWFYLEAEEPIDSWKKGWVFAEFVRFE